MDLTAHGFWRHQRVFSGQGQPASVCIGLHCTLFCPLYCALTALYLTVIELSTVLYQSRAFSEPQKTTPKLKETTFSTIYITFDVLSCFVGREGPSLGPRAVSRCPSSRLPMVARAVVNLGMSFEALFLVHSVCILCTVSSCFVSQCKQINVLYGRKDQHDLRCVVFDENVCCGVLPLHPVLQNCSVEIASHFLLLCMCGRSFLHSA